MCRDPAGQCYMTRRYDTDRCAPTPDLPTSPGTYALILRLERGHQLEVGKLGATLFLPGFYIYLGSAMQGVGARVRRHLRVDKPHRWHIDALTEVADPVALWWHEGKERLECIWAKTALDSPTATSVKYRFGSSDCRCASHLAFFPDRASADTCCRQLTSNWMGLTR